MASYLTLSPMRGRSDEQAGSDVWVMPDGMQPRAGGARVGYGSGSGILHMSKRKFKRVCGARRHEVISLHEDWVDVEACMDRW